LLGDFFAMKVSIQIARAIAVLGVILWHLDWVRNDIVATSAADVPFPILVGGHGVDLFFVISGYIIAFILGRGSMTASEFYMRRVFRIYPFYWAFTLGYVLLIFFGCYLGFRSECSGLGEPLLYITSLAILPQERHPLLGVGWSLEHEIIFYAIAGMVCLIWRKRISMLAVVLGIMVVIGIVIHSLVQELYGFDLWDIHLFSLYQVEFLAGITVFLLQKRLSWIDYRSLLIIGATGFFATVALAEILSGPVSNIQAERAGLSGLFLTVGLAASSASIVLGLLNAEFKDIFRRRDRLSVAAVSALVLVGDASYALYLSHPITYGVMGKAYKFVGISPRLVIPAQIVAVIVAILAAIAWFLIIEKPVLRVAHRFMARSILKNRYVES
jgi:exopolysaccharide production protein ExoZ